MLFRKSVLLILGVIIAMAVSGCGGAVSSGTYVWIDVPVDGLAYPDVQPVKIEGHAAGAEGIAKIELFVDGDLWQTIEDPPMDEELASFEAEFLPPGPGAYTIHAVAYGGGGSASEYDETHITLGMDTPTPVPTLTPVISLTPTVTDTPTPPPEPEASVAFWADPETIDAGGCTDLKWQAENVKSVVFGGVEQDFEGSYRSCLCKSETYTLTVTYLDDSVEKLKANINVVGTCADTTPPPVPNQTTPGNGSSLSCRSYLNLGWSPVSDDSGIAEYQVKAQRHGGDNNWQNVSGSVFSGIGGTSYNMYVECGWYYRWQVRAVDGEGNVGNWSSWWNFVINLE